MSRKQTCAFSLHLGAGRAIPCDREVVTTVGRDAQAVCQICAEKYHLMNGLKPIGQRSLQTLLALDRAHVQERVEQLLHDEM